MGFPTGRDFLVPRDKGTTGQAKLFCPGRKGQQDRENYQGTGFWQSVPSRPWISWDSQGTEEKKKNKKLQFLNRRFFPWFSPVLSQDFPGQRDNRTGKLFCPGTKGQRDVLSLGNPSGEWHVMSIMHAVSHKHTDISCQNFLHSTIILPPRVSSVFREVDKLYQL